MKHKKEAKVSIHRTDLSYISNLISRTGDINSLDSHNKTVICYAIEQEDVRTVKHLLELNATVNIEQQETIFKIAIKHKAYELAAVLLRNAPIERFTHVVNEETKHDPHGSNLNILLYCACLNLDEKHIKTLLEKGARVDSMIDSSRKAKAPNPFAAKTPSIPTLDKLSVASKKDIKSPKAGAPVYDTKQTKHTPDTHLLVLKTINTCLKHPSFPTIKDNDPYFKDLLQNLPKDAPEYKEVIAGIRAKTIKPAASPHPQNPAKKLPVISSNSAGRGQNDRGIKLQAPTAVIDEKEIIKISILITNYLKSPHKKPFSEKNLEEFFLSIKTDKITFDKKHINEITKNPTFVKGLQEIQNKIIETQVPKIIKFVKIFTEKLLSDKLKIDLEETRRKPGRFLRRNTPVSRSRRQVRIY